ncbi:flavodoxin FldA [Candidatus Purcelliella pentastirinorum]|nr:flavodoxin FldA [Candidatus Purcelliella pentastirinorum]
MKKIGIFFGTNTGNTKKVAKQIKKQFKKNKFKVKLYNISKSKKKDIESFNILIFGISTWYYGEVQFDWDNFLPYLKKIDFFNKKIAIFGCGDQEDYTEYFCDAMRIIYNIIKKNNGCIVGNWSIKNYNFKKSRSLINSKEFLGLVIDEDRQSHLTKKRVYNWSKSLLKYFNE